MRKIVNSNRRLANETTRREAEGKALAERVEELKSSAATSNAAFKALVSPMPANQ